MFASDDKSHNAETPDEDPRGDTSKNKVIVSDDNSDRRIVIESSEDTAAELTFAGALALQDLE